MKQITVILFVLVSVLSGDWQQTEEIALPKGIQINDLSISSNGEIWLLSTSAILKLESTSKNPIFIRDITDGRLIAATNENIYLLKTSNNLVVYDTKNETSLESQTTVLNVPTQFEVVGDGDKTSLIALESGHLMFMGSDKSVGTIPTDVDKFSVVPTGNYSETSTPIYTLKSNRVFSWTGGNLANPADYKSQVFYSSSGNILDIAADKNGKLFVLFADSIVVLSDAGKYLSRIETAKLPVNTELVSNPLNNNLVIYNKQDKKLTVLNEVKKETSELMTLNKNFPNPVDNYTEIEFSLGKSLYVTMTVYNLIGEPVKVLAKGEYGKGTHRVYWNACDEHGNLVPNGVYFYRLESGKTVAIKQLIVLR